jgi:hypothetical protein
MPTVVAAYVGDSSRDSLVSLVGAVSPAEPRTSTAQEVNHGDE